MAEIVVTQDHNGGTVSAKVGDVIKLELPENPTTGYRWAVGTVDTKILVLERDDYQPGGQGIGSGGVRLLRFGTRGRGSAGLQCRLERLWESNPPKAVFHVTVKVD